MLEGLDTVRLDSLQVLNHFDLVVAHVKRHVFPVSVLPVRRGAKRTADWTYLFCRGVAVFHWVNFSMSLVEAHREFFKFRLDRFGVDLTLRFSSLGLSMLKRFIKVGLFVKAGNWLD